MITTKKSGKLQGFYRQYRGPPDTLFYYRFSYSQCKYPKRKLKMQAKKRHRFFAFFKGLNISNL